MKKDDTSRVQALIVVAVMLLAFGIVVLIQSKAIDINGLFSKESQEESVLADDTKESTGRTDKKKSKSRKNKTSANVKSAETYSGVGLPIDSFNNVKIYYNGRIGHVAGRSVTPDGYNLGLKYQCVEFIKRYYYEYFNFKMPNGYGHAREYFNTSLPDGAFNSKRGLIQYQNAGTTKPKVNDIIVFGPSQGNSFGHIAIISRVMDSEIEIVQQNVGRQTRVRFPLVHYENYWTVAQEEILGWLRLP